MDERTARLMDDEGRRAGIYRSGCEHEWEPVMRPAALVIRNGEEQHLEGCPKCGRVRYWKVT